MNYMKSILHPTSGRFLEVYSNHPGLQIYTGNMLPHRYIYPPDLESHEWGGSENVQVNSLKSVNCIDCVSFSEQSDTNLKIRSILKLNKYKLELVYQLISNFVALIKKNFLSVSSFY